MGTEEHLWAETNLSLCVWGNDGLVCRREHSECRCVEYKEAESKSTSDEESYSRSFPHTQNCDPRTLWLTWQLTLCGS